MIRVDFYGLDDEGDPKKLASLVWTGSGFRGSPKGSNVLKNILTEEAHHFQENRGVSATQEPELFMELLHKTYRGHRFWATPPQSDQQNDT